MIPVIRRVLPPHAVRSSYIVLYLSVALEDAVSFLHLYV